MNKVSIVSLIVSVLVAPSVMAFGGGTHLGDPKGKVHFNGVVYANSCRIQLGDENKVIDLSPVINTQINKDSAVQNKEFTITLNNCWISEHLIPKLAWERVGNVSQEGYMLNNSPFGARHVALALQDKDGTVIDLNQADLRFPPTEAKGLGFESTLTYKFNVGYIKPKSAGDLPPMPGIIRTQANYRITYI